MRWARAPPPAGFSLRERLPIYPPYLGEPWLDPRLAGHVQALVDPATGLANQDAMPVGRPWQGAERGRAGGGRSRTAAGRRRAGPTCTPRSTAPDGPPTGGTTSPRSTATGTRSRPG